MDLVPKDRTKKRNSLLPLKMQGSLLSMEKNIFNIKKTKEEKYKFDKIIGEGKFSKVYLAHEIITQKEVAIKVVKKEDDFFSALHFWGVEFFASMTDRVISFAQLTLTSLATAKSIFKGSYFRVR